MAIYQFPQSEPNFIESWKEILEPGRPRIIEAYGRTFACVQADVPFQMSFNNGKYFSARRGAEWSLQENERYNIIKLLSNSAQTVEFLTGNFFYHDNVVIPIIQVAKTITKGFAAAQIAAGAEVILYGTGGIGAGQAGAAYSYRKSIIITNNDPGSDLEVLKTDGTRLGTVFFRQAWFCETSDDLVLKNETANPINCRIMENFYLAT